MVNYNTADLAPAATDSKLLETLIQELQAAKAGRKTVGDRNDMANTREAMTTKGVFKLAQQYGILRSLGTTLAIANGSVWQLKQIRRAIELGLGAGSSKQIEIITADSGSRTMADKIRRQIAA